MSLCSPGLASRSLRARSRASSRFPPASDGLSDANFRRSSFPSFENGETICGGPSTARMATSSCGPSLETTSCAASKSVVKIAGRLHPRPHIQDDHRGATALRRRLPAAAQAPAATGEKSATGASRRADCAAGREICDAVRAPGLSARKAELENSRSPPRGAPQIQRHNRKRQRAEEKCAGKQKIHRTSPSRRKVAQNDVIEIGICDDE